MPSPLGSRSQFKISSALSTWANCIVISFIVSLLANLAISAARYTLWQTLGLFFVRIIAPGLSSQIWPSYGDAVTIGILGGVAVYIFGTLVPFEPFVFLGDTTSTSNAIADRDSDSEGSEPRSSGTRIASLKDSCLLTIYEMTRSAVTSLVGCVLCNWTQLNPLDLAASLPQECALHAIAGGVAPLLSVTVIFLVVGVLRTAMTKREDVLKWLWINGYS